MGSWEFVVILIVCLLVVGPEQLPILAKRIGRYIFHFRNSLHQLKSEIEQTDKTKQGESPQSKNPHEQ